MRVGHTFTRHFDLETRQHELLGMDLGEGPSRRVLVTGAVVYAVWMGGLFLIFGWPSQMFFTLYFAPPPSSPSTGPSGRGAMSGAGTSRSGRSLSGT
ncbi:hypothetical protein ACFQ2B_15025 [Streptomyces stramineus]